MTIKLQITIAEVLIFRSSKHTKRFIWSEKRKKNNNNISICWFRILKGSAGMLLKHISEPLYPPLGVFMYSRSRLNRFCICSCSFIVSESYPLEVVLILFSYLKPCQRLPYSLLSSSSRLVQNRSSNKR